MQGPGKCFFFEGVGVGESSGAPALPVIPVEGVTDEIIDNNEQIQKKKMGEGEQSLCGNVPFDRRADVDARGVRVLLAQT